MRIVCLVEADWSNFLVLLQDFRVLKMTGELGCSLDSGVSHLNDFLRVEFFPFLSVKFEVKVFDELGMNEVQEGIANVAIVLKII